VKDVDWEITEAEPVPYAPGQNNPFRGITLVLNGLGAGGGGGYTLDVGRLVLVARHLGVRRLVEFAGRTFRVPLHASSVNGAGDTLLADAKLRLVRGDVLERIGDIRIRTTPKGVASSAPQDVRVGMWLLGEDREHHQHLRCAEFVGVMPWPLAVEPTTDAALGARWVYATSTGQLLGNFPGSIATEDALRELVMTGSLPGCSPLDAYDVELVDELH
jgi:hypothetical protein